MIVITTTGEHVSFINKDHGMLVDSNGVKWQRDSSEDDLENHLIAYTETKNHITTVKLTSQETKRMCQGVQAMLTPTTVEEMRQHVLSLSKEQQLEIGRWPDQKLREVLIDADENGCSPVKILEKMVERELERKKPQEEEEPTENPTGATGTASEARRAPRTTRSTPRPRKQEGSVSVALGEASVLLTPKQLEFMERLSECPGWGESGVNGEYIASEYAQELSDTMNPMSVGAVLTTLREKGLLQTEKRRVGAIKCCIFKLTDNGVQVYNKLAGKEE